MNRVPTRWCWLRTSSLHLRRLALLIVVVTGLFAVLPTAASAAIGAAVRSALSDHDIASDEAGVYIWDLDAGRNLYSLNAHALFTPASNTKLVTSAAALRTWGEEHRITTKILIGESRIAGGIVTGDLYLTGAGDPSLATRSFQKEELGIKSATVESLARRLRSVGIRGVAGSVIGDESWFDDERTVASWKPGIETYACGPLSALCANQGLHDDERVEQPAEYAARLLTVALRDIGVKVAGKARSGQVPARASMLAAQSSAPLRVLLKRMNKASDNYFAEIVLKGLGKDVHGDGSTYSGVRLSQATLEAMDIPAAAYVIRDGSGLSYGNRLTPAAIVRLLGAMSQRPDFEVFYDSLAVAGDDGTLAERMEDTAAEGNARAKTGTLNIATSLSGYVTTANGHLLAYAILVKGDPVDWEAANEAQDEIVAALAKARPPNQLTPPATRAFRQRPASGVDPVHTTGRALQPLVEP